MADLDSNFCAWLAGFYEGEGSFIIRKSSHTFVIQISQNDRRPLDEIARRLGFGKVYIRRDGRHHIWRCGKKAEVERFLKVIFPYVQFQQDQIIEGLQKMNGDRIWSWFSSEEDKYISDNWKSMTDSEIAIVLKRNRGGISSRRRTLGINRIRGGDKKTRSPASLANLELGKTYHFGQPNMNRGPPEHWRRRGAK